MEGAAKRTERERELAWFGAMLPHLNKPVGLERFIGRAQDQVDRVKRFHDAWDKIDRALSRGS